MTKQITMFCDSCLKEIPPVKPGECFPSMIRVHAFGDVGLKFAGSSEKDFHDLTCLLRFLDEASTPS